MCTNHLIWVPQTWPSSGGGWNSESENILVFTACCHCINNVSSVIGVVTRSCRRGSRKCRKTLPWSTADSPKVHVSSFRTWSSFHNSLAYITCRQDEQARRPTSYWSLNCWQWYPKLGTAFRKGLTSAGGLNHSRRSSTRVISFNIWTSLPICKPKHSAVP